MNVAYEKGLHELGDGLFAYLQPDGGWGWSNAGLITADGTSLLVDTLFDLELTSEMLAAMRTITERNPIDAAMNTHGNGDHCYGNQLLPAETRLYSTPGAVELLEEAPPSLLAMMAANADALGPELAEFVRTRFGRFSFEGIELRLPDETFTGRLDVRVGDREVQFVELGPAHTNGDAIAYVPDANVAFTGDLLFIEGTPIVWAGPFSNWLDACERLIALDARALVPGHGPVTDASGVRDVQRYLRYVEAEATGRFQAGMDVEEAAADIDLSDFAGWGDPERIVVNVEAVYRELDPGRAKVETLEHFQRMARWVARH
jgi:cyclase